MLRFFSMMLNLPVEMLSSGAEAFAKAVQQLQESVKHEMKASVEAATATPSPPACIEDAAVISKSSTPAPQKDELMPDQDLSNGEKLKLVRYKVLFVKRGFEHAFPEREELLAEAMDAGQFTAWKIAEFVQDIPHEPSPCYRIGDKWGKVLEAQDCAVKDGDAYCLVRSFPHSEKKYLRLYFEVLSRYDREALQYEERKIEVLEEIRDRMGGVCQAPVASGTSAKTQKTT